MRMRASCTYAVTAPPGKSFAGDKLLLHLGGDADGVDLPAELAATTKTEGSLLPAGPAALHMIGYTLGRTSGSPPTRAL